MKRPNDDANDRDNGGEGGNDRDAGVDGGEEESAKRLRLLEESESGVEERPSVPVLTTPRIFISNLDSTVTEFRIKKAFEPFGQIASMDFVWHKTGPFAGLPRSFCFLSYKDIESAQRAITAMNGRKLSGGSRKIVVGIPRDRPVPAPDPGRVENTAAGQRPAAAPTTHFGSWVMRDKTDDGHRRHHQAVVDPVNSRLQLKRSTQSIDSKILSLERKLGELEKPPLDPPTKENPAHRLPVAPSFSSVRTHHSKYRNRK